MSRPVAFAAMFRKAALAGVMSAGMSVATFGSAWADSIPAGPSDGSSGPAPGAQSPPPGVTPPGTFAPGVIPPAVAGSTPPAGRGGEGRRLSCAQAPKLEAHIQKARERIADTLPKLRAELRKAHQSGDILKAQRISQRIDRLLHERARIDRLADMIERRCPSAGNGPSAGGSGSGSSGSGAGNSGPGGGGSGNSGPGIAGSSA